MSKSNGHISHEAFVRAWQAGESVAQIAKKVGMEPSRTSMRAAMLRKRGVKLKLFPRGNHAKIDVAALNRIVRESSAGERSND